MRTWPGVVLLIVSLVGLLGAARASAAPAMSRGQQFIPVGIADCMARAQAAFQSEGWSNIGASGNFTAAFRGPSGAYITCNIDQNGQAVVNVFVATEGTNDSGVPGGERVRLQQSMAGLAAPPSHGSGVLVGTWRVACCNDALGWTLTITGEQGNQFAGDFSDNAGGGHVFGRVDGGAISFERSGSWGSQTWTAQLVNEGGVLKMINGRWSGYNDATGYATNFHAEKQP